MTAPHRAKLGCTQSGSKSGIAKTIQVRDVPDDVHHRLTIRASEQRRSLSEFVRAEIVEIARRPTMVEMLDYGNGGPQWSPAVKLKKP